MQEPAPVPEMAPPPPPPPPPAAESALDVLVGAVPDELAAPMPSTTEPDVVFLEAAEQEMRDSEIVIIGTRSRHREDEVAEEEAAEGDDRIDEVVVYYGTDRARSDSCAGADRAPTSDCKTVDYYGSDRGELEVGTLTVSIPRDEHQRGDIERPFSWWKIKFPENPAQHIILAEIEPVSDRGDWQQKIQASGADEGFLYVHGYSTTFEAAAYRAAQVAYDLDYQGLPLLYSWPSQGDARGYFTDGEVVELSNEPFIDFLLLAKESGLTSLHLVAHSMGNRLVAKALHTLVQRGEDRQLISELVLAAPDIDAERFREEFAEVLPKLARRVTLYVSDQDRALAAAEGIRERPRAGQTAGKLLGIAGFDSIDASKLELDFLAHSYYANNLNMLADIYCVLVGSVAENRPLLSPIVGDEGPAWEIQPFEALGSIRPDPALCIEEVTVTDGDTGSESPEQDSPSFLWILALLLLVGAAILIYFTRR